MMRLLCFLSFLTLAASGLRADQYWIAYEGNDFPENQGWTRMTGPLGGAQRWIENGSLVIDSRASVQIIDANRMELNGNLDPDPGELFVAQWGLRIDEVIGRVDPAVGIFSDDKWAAAFQFDETTIFSTFETGVSAPFARSVFHEFELRSWDMRSYELYIDGNLAISGFFWLSLIPSRVFWGDSIQGGASLARWDYFRFGVVPEPATFLTVALFVPWLVHGQRR